MSTKQSKNSTKNSANNTSASSAATSKVKSNYTSKTQTNAPKLKEAQPTEVFIPLGDNTFDWSTVVITEPTTQIFDKKDGSPPIELTTSKAFVRGPQGQELPIYFQLAKETVWGINGNWEMFTPKEKQTAENLKGFQIGYPLSSLENFTNPNADEKQTKDTFDTIHRLTAEFIIEECKKPINADPETRKIPTVTYNNYSAVRKTKNPHQFVKPIYEWGKSVDKVTKAKFVNKEKPQTAYLKLVTRGKIGALKCETQIYGPGDKLVSPLKYMKFSDTAPSILTDVEPVVHWEGIFYGGHGKTGYGASNKLRIVQMNIAPAQRANSLPKRRMVPHNQAIENDDSAEGSEGGDGGGFQSPLGDAQGEINTNDFETEGQEDNTTPDEEVHTSEVVVEANEGAEEMSATEEDPQPVVEQPVVVKSNKKKDELIAKRKKHSS